MPELSPEDLPFGMETTMRKSDAVLFDVMMRLNNYIGELSQFGVHLGQALQGRLYNSTRTLDDGDNENLANAVTKFDSTAELLDTIRELLESVRQGDWE